MSPKLSREDVLNSDTLKATASPLRRGLGQRVRNGHPVRLYFDIKLWERVFYETLTLRPLRCQVSDEAR